jgi:hypothetical protein
VSTNPYPATSRYFGLAICKATLPDGASVAYLKRRFVPDPASFATLALYTVVEGDRLDRLTYQYLGDPLQFWRVADANTVLAPDDLETPGRIVRITLPQGLPGP